MAKGADNPFSYEGKRVVITGAYSGVGAALLELIDSLGADHITVVDLKEPSGPATQFVQADLSDESAVDRAIAAIEGPVHVLFNNAGVAATLPTETVMAVNYLAVRRLTEGLRDRMPEGSAVAITASIAGSGWASHVAEIQELLAVDGWDESLAWIAAHPDLFADSYSFSKECMQVYTMWSAREAQRSGLRVNSVCPSPIETPLLPEFRETMSDKTIDWCIEESGRVAQPRDIALALSFLGTDASGFVNGVNLNVDLGFSAGLAMGQVDFGALMA
jgi:NAD(P)-dependent dehydrogenase (short-subunit alcohol dehydrogenase family)